MSKYIDANLLRKEIERQKGICTAQIKANPGQTFPFVMEMTGYDKLLSFLDTLSEEPDKSLEEAAEIIAKNILGRDYLAELDEDCAIDALEDAKNLVKAGAEWQASQMPMPEDTVLFNKGVAEGRRLEKADMLAKAVEGRVFMSFAPGHNQMVMADVDLPTNTKEEER